jgi:hypothetical protein
MTASRGTALKKRENYRPFHNRVLETLPLTNEI